ncbi:MAG TPA: alpha/beta fold hydrolase [Solirubrobacteraceae bacterium]|nr:alpha/beta fold hydrolase [Solirubrobacteraceae bacterium]
MIHQEPVLLLHGQPGNARDWDLVRSHLDPEIPVIAVDRPGYDGVSAPGGIAHSARAAVARLDDDGVEKALVVGLSFGGGVAALIAAHHPDRVSALLLVSPAANAASLQRIDRLMAAPLIGAIFSAVVVAGAELKLGSSPVLGRAARRAFLVEQRAILRELPLLDGALSRIEAPTTVLLGSADRVVPPAAGRRVAAQIPGAELVEIGGAGHALHVTHPRRIAELIRKARTVTVR